MKPVKELSLTAMHTMALLSAIYCRCSRVHTVGSVAPEYCIQDPVSKPLFEAFGKATRDFHSIETPD